MTSAKFSQLFDAYRQQAIETNVALLNVNPTDSTPTWLQLLQRHVREWKQHYGSENQAIEQIKQNYQRICQQADVLGVAKIKAIRVKEDRESQEVRLAFQEKRDLIWARQQQEIATGRISV